MAERGGMRVARDRTPKVSGVGRFSQRTDTQPINVGRLSDSEDLKHGDMQQLRAGVQQRPLSRQQTPRVAPAPPPKGGGSGAGGMPPAIPEHIFSRSTREAEPPTEGMDFGAGAGAEVLTPPQPEDEMDVVLQALVQMTGDQGIANMLEDHREFKAWRSQRDTAPVIPQSRMDDLAVAEPTPTENVDEIALPDLATEEEPTEAGAADTAASVETPASAPPMEGG